MFTIASSEKASPSRLGLWTRLAVLLAGYFSLIIGLEHWLPMPWADYTAAGLGFVALALAILIIGESRAEVGEDEHAALFPRREG